MRARKPTNLSRMLLDPAVPIEVRHQLLHQVCNEPSPEGQAIVTRLLEAATAASTEAEYREKKKECDELLSALEEGPLRHATFDRMLQRKGSVLRAQVLTSEGGLASATVLDETLADRARCGDPVWLDARGNALVFHEVDQTIVGEEARLERWLPGGQVQVSVGELGRSLCRPAGQLLEQRECGEAEPGSTLIVCPRRLIAFCALPREDGLGHFQYLSHEPLPDVIVERDIGAPPAFIEHFTRHMERELLEPAIGRRYRLRRALLLLLEGVPGSGKTLAIDGFANRMMTTTAELIGVPVEALPSRIMRLQSSKVLDKWVGSSDRAIARFFEEAEELAALKFQAPDGREWELPLLVICEEIDALARARGGDPVYDRIETNLLTRLDPARAVFRDRLVFVMCTTNTPQLVDSAFIRRAGGTIAHFGRLGRRSFRAVLEKHLALRPFRGDGGSEDQARTQSIDDLQAVLFGPNAAESGQVEILFTGQVSGVVKHQRDFLTAGLVDRAVQQASAESCDAEWFGGEEPGLTHAGLRKSIDAQVRHIVELLTPHNCGEYLELPDGARVSSVRRIDRPAVLPFELERAS